MIKEKLENVPKHKQFELLVHRIIQVLEGDGAAVKWDDKVPDPHVPGRTRQIDITIKRGGWTTFVECRDHQSPQDVNWIEELYGRKSLIGANAIIAVSSSGFTSTAKTYAKHAGVFIRELNALNEAEIRGWGKVSMLSQSYYSFSSLKMVIHGWQPTNTPKLTDAAGKELPIPDLLRLIIDQLRKSKTEKIRDFKVTLRSIHINGHHLEFVTLMGTVKKHTQRKAVATIQEFLDSSSGLYISSVEGFGDGNNEIIRSQNNNSIIVDLSSLKLPSNSILESVQFDMGEPTVVKSYQMIGPNKTAADKFELVMQFIT